MNKKILTLLLLILSFPESLLAHPLDISSSTYTIQAKSINATTYFHTYEAERLLRTNGINLETGEDYYKNSHIFEQYIEERAKVESGGKPCRIGKISLIRKEMYEIISEGLGAEYSFECDDNIQKVKIHIGFFTEYELQTNRLRIYDLTGTGGATAPIAYKVLNPLIQDYTHDLANTVPEKLVDTDGDKIPDEEERIYRTDTKKIDTDGDFYTDYEEVTMGWNPINPNKSPGQTLRTSMPIELAPVPNGISQGNSPDQYDTRYIKQTNLLDTGFGNVQLRDTLKTITETFKNLSFGGFWYMFGLVVLLGFIHAIGPGHSKGFLVSYILDREKGFFEGLGFVTVFSLVHLADIVFLFLVTKLFFSLYDPTEYMVIIQRVSIAILFFFSVYIFVQSIRKLRGLRKTNAPNVKLLKNEVIGMKNENRSEAYGKGTMNEGSSQNNKREQGDEEESGNRFVMGTREFGVQRTSFSGVSGLKGGILLAFIAGLAPCSFGWSIFLVLFSLGKTAWILPLLAALAIGIWICLFCILVITLFFRDRLYQRFQKLPHYSSVFSSFILIFLSLYLFSLLI